MTWRSQLLWMVNPWTIGNHWQPIPVQPLFIRGSSMMWPELRSSFRSVIPQIQQARSRKTSVKCFFVLFSIMTSTLPAGKVQNARNFPQNARKYPQTSANLKKVSLRNGSRTEFRIPYFFRNRTSEILRNPEILLVQAPKPSEFINGCALPHSPSQKPDRARVKWQRPWARN